MKHVPIMYDCLACGKSYDCTKRRASFLLCAACVKEGKTL